MKKLFIILSFLAAGALAGCSEIGDGSGNEGGGNGNGNDDDSGFGWAQQEATHYVSSLRAEGMNENYDENGEMTLVPFVSEYQFKYDDRKRISELTISGSESSYLNVGTVTFEYGNDDTLTVHLDLAENVDDIVAKLNSDGYITEFELYNKFTVTNGYVDADGAEYEDSFDVIQSSKYSITYYDKFVKSMECTETETYEYDDGSHGSTETYKYDYIWDSGNLLSVDKHGHERYRIVYDMKAAPMSICHTFFFADMGLDPLLGMLGFFGQQPRDLPSKIVYVDSEDLSEYEESFEYTFNENGTIATISYDGDTITYSYLN